jgi:hypothetical protein
MRINDADNSRNVVNPGVPPFVAAEVLFAARAVAVMGTARRDMLETKVKVWPGQAGLCEERITFNIKLTRYKLQRR